MIEPKTINHCLDCNFEIGSGLTHCSFCKSDPERPLQIERIPVDGLKHSYHSNERPGMIFTACCECNRGGNGQAEHKCSCGGLITTWDKLGCWIGEPMIVEAPNED